MINLVHPKHLLLLLLSLLCVSLECRGWGEAKSVSTIKFFLSRSFAILRAFHSSFDLFDVTRRRRREVHGNPFVCSNLSFSGWVVRKLRAFLVFNSTFKLLSRNFQIHPTEKPEMFQISIRDVPLLRLFVGLLLSWGWKPQSEGLTSSLGPTSRSISQSSSLTRHHFEFVISQTTFDK